MDAPPARGAAPPPSADQAQPAADPVPAPASRRWVLILLLGVGLGLTGLALEHTPEPLSTLSAQGGPWLVVGFIAGGLARRPFLGGIAGVAALVLAIAAYYLGKAVVGSPLNPAEYDDNRTFWFTAAVVGGGLFGVGGALWASRGRWARVVMVSALSGTVLMEALWQIRGDPVWLVMTVVAVALPAVLLRGHVERILGVALTIPTAGALWLAAEVVLPPILRFG